MDGGQVGSGDALGGLFAKAAVGPLPAGAALSVGESSGGVEMVCIDREGFAVDHGHHGHGAAGCGKVNRFSGVG